MKNLKFVYFLCVMSLFLVGLTGCQASKGNVGQMQSFNMPAIEPSWIRNGEPIEYEGEWWYPQDGIESLLDSEVHLLGKYRETQYFIDKIDVRPYERLYTKFGKNKFRYFKKRAAE